MLKKLIMPVLALGMVASVYAASPFDNGKGINIKDAVADLDMQVPPASAAQAETRASKEWTIMVYVNAKNNLERFGLSDVNEMEMVGSSDKVNIVVELGRIDGYSSAEGDWVEARRYLIKKDNDVNNITSPAVERLGKVDMGDWRHLAEFGKWAKANYPAKKYMLIVWNHGSGWDKNLKSVIDKGISYDDETGNHITTPQLGMAIKEIGRLDVYGADACLLQIDSVAYEIKDNITYIVSSEETEPGDGYTYNTFLAPVVANPTMTPYQLAKVTVDAYTDHYVSAGYACTQSFIRTAAIVKPLGLMNDFAYAVTNNVPRETVKSAVSGAQNFAVSSSRDLYHFVQKVLEKSDNAEVQEKGKALMSYIKKSVVAYHRYNNSSGGWWGPEIYDDTHGIAVYLPGYSYDSDYNELQFAKYSNWDEFIQWYLAKEI